MRFLIPTMTIILVFGTFQNLPSQSCADGSFSYDNDILPILSAKCGSCHTVNSTAGFNVSTYSGLLAGGMNCGPAVTPGDASPLASSLIDKTQWVTGANNANCGGNMPTFGTALTPGEFEDIQTWISDGAQESCLALADCLASHGDLEIKALRGFFGCLDPEATNFNPNAAEDNGSCIYARDKFIGDYKASINCPNDVVLMLINTDCLTFNISQGLNPADNSSVIITFTSGAILGLSLSGTVDDNNLILPETIFTGIPFSLAGTTLLLDITLGGEFICLADDQINGQFDIIATQESGAILGSDTCELMATSI